MAIPINATGQTNVKYSTEHTTKKIIMLNFGVEELQEDSYQDASFSEPIITPYRGYCRWDFCAGLLSLLIWSKAAQAGCVRVHLHLFTPAMIKSVVNETILKGQCHEIFLFRPNYTSVSDNPIS
jgi:hypothetical protein